MDLKPSVLITGASGLVGSRIVELLNDKFDFIPMGLEEGVDITDFEKISEFANNKAFEFILHLAAFTNTSEAEKQTGDEKGLCFQINVIGTRNIARLAKEKNAHLFHLSTEYVFDGEKKEPYVEEDLSNPVGWYSKTKYFSEKEVDKSGSKNTIVRIAAPYRANYTVKEDLVHQILTGLKNNSLAPRFDDTFITPTFVDDIAQGISGLLIKKPEGIFHLTGDDFISPFELARTIARIFSFDQNMVKPSKSADYEKVTGRKYAKSLKISNSKIKQLLALQVHSLDEALKIIKQEENL